jgi:hypothetical protein
MITGTPSDLDINGATNRGIASAVLPAGYGTTIVIVFSGKPAAAAPRTSGDNGESSAAKIKVVHFIGKSSLGMLNILHDILETMTVAPLEPFPFRLNRNGALDSLF